jgi:hypothetical protein
MGAQNDDDGKLPKWLQSGSRKM